MSELTYNPTGCNNLKAVASELFPMEGCKTYEVWFESSPTMSPKYIQYYIAVRFSMTDSILINLHTQLQQVSQMTRYILVCSLPMVLHCVMFCDCN